MPSCKTLLLSASSSNQGKTFVTASLAYLLRAQGKRVQLFKTGPDFLDPKILEFASGNPVYQLDLWMVGESECQRLLYEAANSHDAIIVEGVMGLFDGTPSTADLARRFNLPVATIVNAGALAQTLHAVSFGLANFDPALNYVGTVANHVASERHAAMIENSAPSTPRYLGAIMHTEGATLPSRHLGLVQAEELEGLDKILQLGAEQIAKTHLADAFEEVTYENTDAHQQSEASLKNRTIAIAKDKAFSFLYNANIEALKNLGATIRYFSPLTDQAIPNADAIYLPGGYPELHLSELSANESMKASLREHHREHKPIYAECGGMMYLLDQIVTGDGVTAQMVGLLPGTCTMQKRLSNLGFLYASTPQGKLRGHTFHYSKSEITLEPAFYCNRAKEGTPLEPFYQKHSLSATYAHFYFNSCLSATANFFREQQNRSLT
jgi:cobyrinic acid a,c-diamide synthase